MTNRFVACARWLAEQAMEGAVVAARKVRRLLGDESTGSRNQYHPDAMPKRTRQTGILKAVLRVLAAGPCPLGEVVAQASVQQVKVAMEQQAVSVLRPYTRAQVLVALRYAQKRGYVTHRADGRWAVTVVGLMRSRPGHWATPEEVEGALEAAAVSQAYTAPGIWIASHIESAQPMATELVFPDGGIFE